MTEEIKKLSTLCAKIEAMLFVSSGLVSAGQIAKALELTDSEAENAISALESSL